MTWQEPSDDGPLDYREADVIPALRDIVEAAWYLDGPTPERFEKILPLPFVHLIINLSDPYIIVGKGETRLDHVVRGAFVSGVQSTYLVNRNPRRIRHFGVRFRVDGFAAVSKNPLADSVDAAESAIDGVDELREQLANAEPTAGLAAVQSWLQQQVFPVWRPNPLVRTAIRTIERNPAAPVGDVARELGVTPQTLIRAMKRLTGLTPKRYAEIYRHFVFVSSVPDAPPFPTWAELVAQAGYYDQPHFIRSFVRFTGMTPRRYLESKQHPGAAPSFIPEPER